MSEADAKKLRRLIRIYVQWCDADSWKGGGDPDSIPEIERGLRKAKKNLFGFIRSLTGKPAEEK